MTYQYAKQHAFARGLIPDGYNGDMAEVYFTYDQNTQRTLCIHQHGYFTAPIPLATDVAEAYWLLLHHPSSRATTLINIDPSKE